MGPDRTVEETIPDRVVRVPVRVDERMEFNPSTLNPLEQPAGISGAVQVVDQDGMPARDDRDSIDSRAPIVGTRDLPDPFRDFLFFVGIWDHRPNLGPFAAGIWRTSFLEV